MTSMYRFIKRLLASETTPVWFVVFTGIAAFCGSLLVSELQYSRALRDSRIDAKVAEASARIAERRSEVERQSLEFQTYAGAFVSAILDSTTSVEEKRTILIQNILAQDAAIDLSADLVISLDPEGVTNYRTALRAMKLAVEQSDDVISLTQFWDAASNLLVARDRVLDAFDAAEARNGT